MNLHMLQEIKTNGLEIEKGSLKSTSNLRGQ